MSELGRVRSHHSTYHCKIKSCVDNLAFKQEG